MFYLLYGAAPAVHEQWAAGAPVDLQHVKFAATGPKREDFVSPRQFNISRMEAPAPAFRRRARGKRPLLFAEAASVTSHL
jgi:hypothetical protein